MAAARAARRERGAVKKRASGSIWSGSMAFLSWWSAGVTRVLTTHGRSRSTSYWTGAAGRLGGDAKATAEAWEMLPVLSPMGLPA
jgi:hypothetical protein